MILQNFVLWLKVKLARGLYRQTAALDTFVGVMTRSYSYSKHGIAPFIKYQPNNPNRQIHFLSFQNIMHCEV